MRDCQPHEVCLIMVGYLFPVPMVRGPLPVSLPAAGRRLLKPCFGASFHHQAIGLGFPGGFVVVCTRGGPRPFWSCRSQVRGSVLVS